jgi:hypothetical protein
MTLDWVVLQDLSILGRGQNGFKIKMIRCVIKYSLFTTIPSKLPSDLSSELLAASLEGTNKKDPDAMQLLLYV